MTPWLLIIAGVSASGKTTLASYLAAQLERDGLAVTQIAMDAYYRDYTHRPLAERAAINFDHPASFDDNALRRDIESLRQGGTVKLPEYDYCDHRPRSSAVVTRAGEVIIVEGILPLHFASLRELADFRVFIDTPLEECYRRRLKRDIEYRGRTEASVKRQFEEHVLPMYQRFIAPQKYHADTVLTDGGEQPALFQEIRQRSPLCTY